MIWLLSWESFWFGLAFGFGALCAVEYVFIVLLLNKNFLLERRLENDRAVIDRMLLIDKEPTPAAVKPIDVVEARKKMIEDCCKRPPPGWDPTTPPRNNYDS